jgi:hypothetical protein
VAAGFFANQVVPIDSSEEFIKQLLENGRRPFIALTGKKLENSPDLQQLEISNQSIIARDKLPSVRQFNRV